MIVYNTTIKIESAIEKEWVEWQKKENIPRVLSTGLFTDHKFFRLLEQDETDPTYVIQYFTNSLDQYIQFLKQFDQLFKDEAFKKWGDQFVSFHTVMQIVN